ncbi:MAG: hypothetical protein L6V95_09765 [Candidatus Melainabacteria bacterium]|nr:MAG: hypothetical protein L6V95_09765 [Candidatus Melainabacteria bacterium]
MYIAEVTATNQWQKLEDLIKQKVSSFAFENGKEYTIQNQSNIINLIELDTAPTEQNGFYSGASKEPIVYAKTSGDLYVRALSKSLLVIADNS